LLAKRNHQHVEEESPVEEDPIMAKLKAQLAGRGAKGVIGLGKLFKVYIKIIHSFSSHVNFIVFVFIFFR
jgi:hypothetical protein